MPTSPWQPTSAPEIDALRLTRLPISPAVASARQIFWSDSLRLLLQKIKHRGKHAASAAGRRGDHLAAGCVLFGDGQRVSKEPRRLAEVTVQTLRTRVVGAGFARYLELAGQPPFAVEAARDGAAHGVPDACENRPDRRPLVFADEFPELQAVALAARQDFVHAGVGVDARTGVLPAVLVAQGAAAERIDDTRSKRRTGRVERFEL